MADAVYNSFKAAVFSGDIEFLTDDIAVMLVSGGYTVDIDTHIVTGDLSQEVIGTGYVHGGQNLSSKSVVKDTGDDEGVFDADDVTWSTSTITARAAVLYNRTNSALIAYFDFGSDKTSEAGNFTIQWGAEGILNCV